MSEKSSEHPTPHQVQSVYKCIGKFISYMFKKAHYEWVSADLGNFGTVTRNTQSGTTSFSPANSLQVEIGSVRGGNVAPLAKDAQKQELTLSKIA